METVEFITAEVPAEESEPEPEPAVGGLPPSVGPTTVLRFMQEDELAQEVPSEQPSPEEVPVTVEVEETIAEVNVNGHAVVEETVTITTTTEVSHLKGCLARADVTLYA